MTRLVDDLKPLVLEQLERSPKTLKELERSLGHNYYTVRMSVQLLMQDGLVTSTGLGARNGKYMLRKHDGMNNSIPTIMLGTTAHKLVNLLRMRHQDNFAAVTAVQNLPMHLARLFMTALRLKNNISQGDTLERIRSSMETDRDNLLQALKLYDAILNNSMNWTEYTLVRYTDDKMWDEAEILSAYHHYFESEEIT